MRTTFWLGNGVPEGGFVKTGMLVDPAEVVFGFYSVIAAAIRRLKIQLSLENTNGRQMMCDPAPWLAHHLR
jgi:hypothetical protein